MNLVWIFTLVKGRKCLYIYIHYWSIDGEYRIYLTRLRSWKRWVLAYTHIEDCILTCSINISPRETSSFQFSTICINLSLILQWTSYIGGILPKINLISCAAKIGPLYWLGFSISILKVYNWNKYARWNDKYRLLHGIFHIIPFISPRSW